MSRLIKSSTIMNDLTGEVTHSETHVINVKPLDKEPPYVKMYINDIGIWQGLSPGETAILYQVSSAVDYDGIVSLSKYHKDKIKKILDVSDGFIRNTLTKLVAKHILLKTEAYSGVYKLNPYWFGKGDWKDIIEQRKAFVVQITKAYGMPLPENSINGISFVEINKKLNIHKADVEVREKLEQDGQQRLID
jgi:hypothetical protein